jgi:hypothetical protein
VTRTRTAYSRIYGFKPLSECDELSGVDWRWQAADGLMNKTRFGVDKKVLDVCDVVDPPGGHTCVGGQGAHHPPARPRRGEAELHRGLGAEAACRAVPGAAALRDRARPGPAAREVEQIMRSAQTPVSLEKPVGDKEEITIGRMALRTRELRFAVP